MEFKPKQETKKIPEVGYDLLNLDASKAEQLKTRIKKWQGLVRMFVHPMFEKWRWGDEYPGHPHKAELFQIEEVLAKLLAMPEEKTPAMIIFEEVKHLEELKCWLKENPQGISQNGVYFVATGPKPGSPTPDVRGKDEKEAWKTLSDKLTELGVKKILMAGQQLDVSEFKQDWTEKGPWVARCVGIALSHLSKDKAGKFEVELSALTMPREKRDYFNKAKNKDNITTGGLD